MRILSKMSNVEVKQTNKKHEVKLTHRTVLLRNNNYNMKREERQQDNGVGSSKPLVPNRNIK